MEDITPLVIYISSCEEYHRQNGYGRIDNILINLIMDGDYEELSFFSSNSFNHEMSEYDSHRISRIKKYRNCYYLRLGYCKRYVKPFRILFKGLFSYLHTEEERLQLERESREVEEAYIRELESMPDNFVELEALEDRGEDWNSVQSINRYYERLDSEEEELSINDFRTFKLEQCVICLDEEPNVIFCNCGHLCICKTCLVRKLDKCPVCKKENTILRIIE